MFLCNYADHLEIENGEIVRVLVATPRNKKKCDKSLAVYREWESGKCEVRNLYYCGMSGYRVAIPDVVSTGSYMPGIAKLEPWCDTKKMSNFQWYSKLVDDETTKIICSKYPKFKYVINKFSTNLNHIMEALIIWKEHPEVELIIASGYIKVALNRSFWKMTEARRKEVVNFIRKNPTSKDLRLGDIQTIIKYNLSADKFNEYHRDCMYYGKIAYDVYSYLKKKKVDYTSVSLYRDYARLLKQTNHKCSDPYWKFPKDLQKKHDELREEVRRLDELKQIEKLRPKQDSYRKAVKRLLKYKMDINGFTVFVPETIDEISRQANALNQCLITADYISKVINKSCVLVFIQKNGEPIATAELKKGNKIGQFYTNELDRRNCLPSDEVREVMNKWIEMKEAA